MYQQWSILCALFIASVSARYVLESGKEYVSEYTLSVGSEDHGHEHNGFALKMQVIAHKIADEVVGLHIEEVQLLNDNNAPLVENPKTTKFKESLGVPFEYSSNDPLPLKIFSPETVSSESVNIKRGLINLWKYYDPSKGKAYGTEINGPSGKCRESFYATETGDGKSISYNRFNSFQNCTPTVEHEETKTQSMMSQKTKVIRTVSYEYRMGLKPGDPFHIKSTERLKFDSSIPRGLFDSLVVKQHLKYVEVRDSNEVLEHGGDFVSTTLEVNHPLQADQDEEETHRAFSDLLHQFASNLQNASDISDSKLPTAFLGLNHYLSQMSWRSIKQISFRKYPKLDPELDMAPVLTQLLAFSAKLRLSYLIPECHDEGHDDSYNEGHFECYSETEWRNIHKRLGQYYEKLASQGNPETIDEEVTDNCKNLIHSAMNERYPFNDTDYRSFGLSLSASCSAILQKACLQKGQCINDFHTEFEGQVDEHLVGMSPNKLIHLINVFKNMHTVKAVPLLVAVIGNKEMDIKVRTQASWALYSIGIHHPREVQEFALKALADRSEDHEIRITAFMMSLLDNNLAKIQTVVQYIVDNHEKEDRELVTFVFTYFKAASSVKGSLMKGPHKHLFETAKYIYANMLEGHERIMGSKDMFGTGNHVIELEDSTLIISAIASKTDIIPRHVYISYSDPQQSRSMSFSAFSKNFHLKLMAKLMKSMAANRLKHPKGSSRSPINSTLLFDDEDDSLPGYFSVNDNGLDVNFATFKNYKELRMKFHANVFMFKKVAHLLNIFNTIKTTSHTESGLRMSFFTTQGAVNSVVKPEIMEQFNYEDSEQEISQQSLTVLMPATQLHSTTFYTSFVGLPETDFRYISGKKLDKAINLPTVGLSVVVAENGLNNDSIHFSSFIELPEAKFTKPFDVFYRSLNKFAGTVSGVNPMELPLKPQTVPTQIVDSQHHLPFGYRMERTVGYKKPSSQTSPLTRWFFRYQEIDSHSTPFTYRVSLIPHSNPNVKLRSTISLAFAKTLETSGHVAKLVKLKVMNTQLESSPDIELFLNPLEVTLRQRVLPSDPKTRTYDMTFRSHPLKTFISSKWSAVSHDYPEVASKDETIAIKGTMSFEDPREEAGHGAHGDHEGHEVQSSPAHEGHESHEAHECLIFNGSLYRTEEQKAKALEEGALFRSMGLANDEGHVLKALLEDMDDPRDFKDTCYARKRFLGMSLDINILREPTEEVKQLYRKFRDALIKRNYRHISYDFNDKLDQNTIKLRVNSSMDIKQNEMTIQDKNGKQIFTGFESKVLPYFIRSNCAIKPSPLHDMKQPICTLRVEGNRLFGATFDGLLVKDHSLEQCTYRLASDCGEGEAFSVNYNQQERSVEVKYKTTAIILSSKTILVNGVNVTPKVGTFGMTKMFESLIITGATVSDAVFVKLPNHVTIGLMAGTTPTTGHLMVQASRLMKGRFCGVCGDMNGDPSDDLPSTETCLGLRPLAASGCDPNSCPCTYEYSPVCGTDGVTYPNTCAFNCSKKCDPTLTLKAC